MGHAQTRGYYDDFSGWYERERGRGYHAMIDDLEMEIVAPLARGARALEVGCGTGLILERISRVADDAWGVDLSAGMLGKARARGLKVVQGSATHVPFSNASFDLVCSFKVLAHVPDIGRALSEAARVTRPGGHMVLEFYNPFSLRYLAKRLAGPGAISAERTEAEVYTRWDSPWTIHRILPPGVDLVDFRGVRIVTPAAVVHRVPGLSQLVRRAERACVTSPLRFLGGFLVAIIRRRP